MRPADRRVGPHAGSPITLASGMLLLLMALDAGAHQGHLNPAPWLACDDKQIGTMCAFENSRGDVYRGSCRAVSERLICVRIKPIEAAPQKPSAHPE